MAEYLDKDEVLKAIDRLPLIAESKVETTLSGDIKLDKAIKYLHEQYDKALKMDYVKNPLAWALYQTWRYVDKGNGARKKSNLLETEVEGLYLNIPEEVEQRQMCETCRYYNNNTYWCSQYNDTTYHPNCSSYQVKED